MVKFSALQSAKVSDAKALNVTKDVTKDVAIEMKILAITNSIYASSGENCDMNKIKEMNKDIFRDNLIMTVKEIMLDKDIEEKKLRFKIIPVYEGKKSFNAVDDSMRLIALSDKNIGNRLLTLDETVRLVACKSPLVPIWINISLNEINCGNIIFKFETSLRFRKPSLLRNVETGHPPFKAIL